MASVTKPDWRRWVENQRAVAHRQAQEPLDAFGRPANAIAASLQLIALYGRLHGWPAPEDPVTRREDLEMWERFSRLRAIHTRG